MSFGNINFANYRSNGYFARSLVHYSLTLCSINGRVKKRGKLHFRGGEGGQQGSFSTFYFFDFYAPSSLRIILDLGLSLARMVAITQFLPSNFTGGKVSNGKGRFHIIDDILIFDIKTSDWKKTGNMKTKGYSHGQHG